MAFSFPSSSVEDLLDHLCSMRHNETQSLFLCTKNEGAAVNENEAAAL